MKKSDFLLFVVLGIIFWLNGVLVIRLIGNSFLTENNPKLILSFILAIPITFITLFITKFISKLNYSQLLRPIVIMTFTATTFDSIALTYFRKIYNESFEISLHGSALILWGAGLGLMFTYYFEQKESKIN